MRKGDLREEDLKTYHEKTQNYYILDQVYVTNNLEVSSRSKILNGSISLEIRKRTIFVMHKMENRPELIKENIGTLLCYEIDEV